MTSLIPLADPKKAVTDAAFDAVVLVTPDPKRVRIEPIAAAVAAFLALDEGWAASVQLLVAKGIAGGRLVLAPVGSMQRDGDDVRRYAEAAAAGMARAKSAGAVAPLLLVDDEGDDPDFARAVPVAALGALGALWQPLEAREALGGDATEPVVKVGLAATSGAVDARTTAWIEAVEGGRRVARDLCGTNPERMAPPAFADHCRQVFADLPVEVMVKDALDELVRDYPLLSAVARASTPIERHQPRVVRLTYQGEGPITQTLLIAGKGVTYDTGGADLKTGGHMAGMSRDKGGAAAAAGLVHAIAKLKPKGIAVIAELGVVRNSIGAEAFVADEIIRSHAGVRVRIGNTDAEGRLVMADCLSHLRVLAAEVPNPQLFTLATLTGHAQLAVGPYSIAMDNRPARRAGIGAKLVEQGDAWGDPFEISRLRREDFDFIKPRTKADDVMSCNNGPSSRTIRGHQFPAVFLAIAAGLEDHGHKGADPAYPYTHLDIAGSGVEGGDWQHGRPTAAPVVAMLCALVEAARL
jgi:leucyl aminopeptidase